MPKNKLTVPVKEYKAFNPDMTCKGFKFKEGKTYKEDVWYTLKGGEFTEVK
jgi:hypothetical protein